MTVKLDGIVIAVVKGTLGHDAEYCTVPPPERAVESAASVQVESIVTEGGETRSRAGAGDESVEEAGATWGTNATRRTNARIPTTATRPVSRPLIGMPTLGR
ncbi:MAG: hypothetical protein L3K03_04295 [Thermoplasmata archaeon]|nr:hypothetical protein [Thermoplasmata archaeon]